MALKTTKLYYTIDGLGINIYEIKHPKAATEYRFVIPEDRITDKQKNDLYNLLFDVRAIYNLKVDLRVVSAVTLPIEYVFTYELNVPVSFTEEQAIFDTIKQYLLSINYGVNSPVKPVTFIGDARLADIKNVKVGDIIDIKNGKTLDNLLSITITGIGSKTKRNLRGDTYDFLSKNRFINQSILINFKDVLDRKDIITITKSGGVPPVSNQPVSATSDMQATLDLLASVRKYDIITFTKKDEIIRIIYVIQDASKGRNIFRITGDVYYTDGSKPFQNMTFSEEDFESYIQDGQIITIIKSSEEPVTISDIQNVEAGDVLTVTLNRLIEGRYELLSQTIVNTIEKKSGSEFILNGTLFSKSNDFKVQFNVITNTAVWDLTLNNYVFITKKDTKNTNIVPPAKPENMDKIIGIYITKDSSGNYSKYFEILNLETANNDLSESVFSVQLMNTSAKPFELKRKNLFVAGDRIMADTEKGNDFHLDINFIEEIKNNFDIEISYSLDNSGIPTRVVKEKFFTALKNIKIIEFADIQTKFITNLVSPVIPSATPSTSVKEMETQITKINKNIGDLVFIRSLVSPINFEKKIELSQSIEEKQKDIDKLTFDIQEAKLADNHIFDELFEQSFIPLKNEYKEMYSKAEESEFFTPNGKRSELSDELNELIRTPQFKSWFGDWEISYLFREVDAPELACSTILNENFEPLLAWHGTGSEFSSFRFETFPAAYFARKEAYSRWFADFQGSDDGYTLPFFLNIRNPLDLRHYGTDKVLPKQFFDYLFVKTGMDIEELDANPILLDPAVPALEVWIYIRRNAKMLKKIADAKIFDGIRFFETNPNVNVGDEAYSTEAFIIFDPNQCKLADSSRGALLLASLKSFLLKKGGKI